MSIDRGLLLRIREYASNGDLHLGLSDSRIAALVERLRVDHAEYRRKRYDPFCVFVIRHVNHILAGAASQQARKRKRAELVGHGSDLLNRGLRASYKGNNEKELENRNERGLEKKGEEEAIDKGGSVAAAAAAVTPENVKFENFGGLEERVLEPIYRCIYRLHNPHSFPRQKSVSGILLHGPPGCGKTLLAYAIANEAEVPIRKVAPAELSSGAAIRSIFADVATLARCVLLLDEIDAVAMKRDAARKDVDSRSLTQLMTCIDGLNHLWDASRQCAGHVIIVGTTNRLEDIDPALRRSGRLTIEIALNAPDEQARKQILSVLTRDTLIEGSRDFTGVAKRTRGFVAADLFELTQQASFIAEQRRNASLRSADEKEPWWKFVNTVKEEPATVMEDYEAAASQVQGSMTREGFSSRPNISWEDVGGLNKVVEELKSCISRCITPSEMCKKLGVRTSAGFLLHGPPGCGKTLIAKAAASYAEANFISVKGPELLRKYLGDSEEQVRILFRRARECSPCVICLDEVDSLCPKRGTDGNTAVDRVVNQFLVEMDGLQELNGVIVIATTNRIEAVDEAFLRPGRLGHHVRIPLPDEEARVSILKALTHKRPLAAEVDLAKLATSAQLEGLSGSHLSELVEQACIAAVDEGTAEICQHHFETAREKLGKRLARVPSVDNNRRCSHGSTVVTAP
ncbi:cell division control protein 48 homolog C [Selaginella moellendorffii]|uniref:cell division control protein 48 homolog C n=1 Tax=Selaginella moellendorffii TaxID=88036 RepID=UPI000D1CC6AF|nr:cell division control protein 48 homolog C [Selaginella moellendorffii]|eukprot:XP_024528832.1 cell division control protein 48 homolog C [Selaginella moellendorffii]